MRKWLKQKQKQKKRKQCNGRRFMCNSGLQCRGQITRVFSFWSSARLFCQALCFLVYVYGLLNWNFFHAKNREQTKEKGRKKQHSTNKSMNGFDNHRPYFKQLSASCFMFHVSCFVFIHQWTRVIYVPYYSSSSIRRKGQAKSEHKTWQA